MNELHSLLKRQLRRFTSETEIEETDFLRAINVQERLRDRRAEAGSRVGLAEMYASMGDFQSARGQYTTAAQLYRTAGDTGTASLIDAKVSQIAVA